MENMTTAYNLDEYITEIYDQSQPQTEDIDLLKKLLGKGGPKRVFEPFCGTGRIFMQLAGCGHSVIGMDNSAGMLASAQRKLEGTAEAVRRLVTLLKTDILSADWPMGFDAVLLANNSLYELPTPEKQRECVCRAGKSLKPGGKLYLDNYCVYKTLNPIMHSGSVYTNVFPTGTCKDGAMVSGSMEIVELDINCRRIVNRHSVVVTRPDGTTSTYVWVQERHIPHIEELKTWVAESGFKIKGLWGSRKETPYVPDSPRAVIWAVRE